MSRQEQRITRREEWPNAVASPAETEPVRTPGVDISESPEAFRLVADLPGADAASVSVTVAHNVLTIEGTGRVEAPDGYQLVGQEFGAGAYRRGFALSEALDTGKIRARVRHGVLDVTLPKREALKPRTIPIEA